MACFKKIFLKSIFLLAAFWGGFTLADYSAYGRTYYSNTTNLPSVDIDSAFDFAINRYEFARTAPYCVIACNSNYNNTGKEVAFLWFGTGSSYNKSSPYFTQNTAYYTYNGQQLKLERDTGTQNSWAVTINHTTSYGTYWKTMVDTLKQETGNNIIYSITNPNQAINNVFYYPYTVITGAIQGTVNASLNRIDNDNVSIAFSSSVNSGTPSYYRLVKADNEGYNYNWGYSEASPIIFTDYDGVPSGNYFVRLYDNLGNYIQSSEINLNEYKFEGSVTCNLELVNFNELKITFSSSIISGTPIYYRLVDSEGNGVYQWNFDDSSPINYIDSDGIPSGNYYLRLYDGEANYLQSEVLNVSNTDKDIQNINNGIGDINSNITDDNVSIDDSLLPNVNETDITLDGFSKIFDTVRDWFSSDSDFSITVKVPFTDKSFVISKETIYANFNLGIIEPILNGFWYFIISLYILNDISKLFFLINSGRVQNIYDDYKYADKNIF